MRIAMIVSAPLPPREGMGFYVWNLSRHLVRQGHTVHIITRGGQGKTRHEVVDDITIWRPAFVPLYPFHVHVHGLFIDNLVRRLEREIDLFHLHTPLVKTPNTRQPVLATIHTPMKADVSAIPANSRLGWLVRLQAPFSYRLEQQLFNRADKITVVAHSVASELGAYGIDPRLASVLGNGVDTGIFRPQVPAATAAVSGSPVTSQDKLPNQEPVYPGDWPQHQSQPYLFTVGRLAPRKGLEDLLDCAEQVAAYFPQYRFMIAGAGPLEKELKLEIVRRRLQMQVILLGHVADRLQLASLYQGATAYVHPAHYEGLPTALLEAMACARPVAATAVSGALDVVQHGRNGLLVPARAPGQMAAAIMRLLGEPDLRQQLGQAAVKTIRESYSWDAVSRRYLAEYEALLEACA